MPKAQSKKNPSYSYDELFELKKRFEKEVGAASKKLKSFPKGKMGLTSDEAKKTIEWKMAKLTYDNAFSNLHNVNAAINKVKKKKNPGTLQDAMKMNEDFHGRGTKVIEDVEYNEFYDENLAQVGVLTELEILVSEDEVQPITFYGNNIKVCCTGDGLQMYFVGGKQKLDLDKLDIKDWEGKRKVTIGPAYSISYMADKHHLTGSKQQKSGSEYIHKLGEEGGDMPIVVYDNLNQSIELVGGSYHVEDRGIVN